MAAEQLVVYGLVVAYVFLVFEGLAALTALGICTLLGLLFWSGVAGLYRRAVRRFGPLLEAPPSK
jgi:hypothetical protein